eukprot:scaffold1087_cov136-Cylindrotheca_fusiformis.AAC.14
MGFGRGTDADDASSFDACYNNPARWPFTMYRISRTHLCSRRIEASRNRNILSKSRMLPLAEQDH